MPRFSVVVPTCNRKELVRDAQWSVLRQTFTDFELVIIDNSDDGYECVDEIINDPRVRYVRTGGLSMPDNWERAYGEAIGEYVCVLSDRLVWSSRILLEVVNNQIEKTEADIVTWKFVQPQRLGNDNKRSGISQLYRSSEILDAILNANYRMFADVAPRGLNSAVRCSLVEEATRRTARYCHPLNPDYTGACSALLNSDFVVHLDANAVYEQGLDVSNGLNCRSDYRFCSNSLAALGGHVERSYAHVPAKFASLYNSIFNDVAFMLDLYGANVPFQDWNVKGYVQLLSEDLLRYSHNFDCTEFYAQLSSIAKEHGIDPPRQPYSDFPKSNDALRRMNRKLKSKLKSMYDHLDFRRSNEEHPPVANQATCSIREIVRQLESTVFCPNVMVCSR